MKTLATLVIRLILVSCFSTKRKDISTPKKVIIAGKVKEIEQNNLSMMIKTSL